MTDIADFYIEIEPEHIGRFDGISDATVTVYPTADHSWHRRVEMRTRHGETLAETAPAVLADLGLRATEPITVGRRFAAEKDVGTDLATASSPTLVRIAAEIAARSGTEPLSLAEARDTLLGDDGRSDVLVTVVYLPRYRGRGPRSAVEVGVTTGSLDCIWSGSSRGSAGVVVKSPCGMDSLSADFDAAVVIPRPDLGADSLLGGAESSAAYAGGPVLTAAQSPTTRRAARRCCWTCPPAPAPLPVRAWCSTCPPTPRSATRRGRPGRSPTPRTATSGSSPLYEDIDYRIIGN